MYIQGGFLGGFHLYISNHHKVGEFCEYRDSELETRGRKVKHVVAARV
jgi:bifunctional N-acetylglucosamine-1-phosphate-uridyltransferase/glucosamine-1-phosphate-acetyltransferase GlmU-like protein